MACCGRSKRNRSGSRTVAPENPPALKSAPPPPTPAVAPPVNQRSAFVPEKTPTPTPVPEMPKQAEGMPKCRYREFKSRTIQGGQTVNVYWCRAFSMNVRDYHCRACQKHDK